MLLGNIKTHTGVFHSVDLLKMIFLLMDFRERGRKGDRKKERMRERD